MVETQESSQEQEKKLKLQETEFRDLKRSSLLLGSAKSKVEEQAKSLRKSSLELEKHLNYLGPSLSNEADLERYRIDIENMSKLMQNSLNELLDDEPSLEKINATKFTIGNNLASLLQAIPRPVFMKLIEDHQASEISLTQQKLRALPLQDDITPDFIPENFQPLQKLLYEVSWVYADTRARARKARKSAASSRSELAELKSQILCRINDNFKDDSEKLLNEQKFFELEIQVALKKGAVDALRLQVEELDEFCLQHEARQLEIEQKIATIERNSRLSDQLTALICTMVRKRADNAKVVQQLTNQSRKIVNEDILPLLTKLKENIQLSKNNFDKELESYQQLKPSQLLNVRLAEYVNLLFLFS